WRIEYQGTAIMLRHSRGLTLLAHLVHCPGRAIHVRELDAMTPSGGAAVPRPEAPDSDLVAVPGDAGEVLDRQALSEYRSRVGELRAEIDDADACGDAARAEALRGELDMLASELRSAVGAGGRVRRVAPEVERLRVAITRRIRSTIVKIAEHHPKLGAHLQAHVSTGYTCAYEPGDTTDATARPHCARPGAGRESRASVHPAQLPGQARGHMLRAPRRHVDEVVVSRVARDGLVTDHDDIDVIEDHAEVPHALEVSLEARSLLGRELLVHGREPGRVACLGGLTVFLQEGCHRGRFLVGPRGPLTEALPLR